MLLFLLAMHVNSLCACSHPEAMKGSSSLRLLILLRLLTSPFWAQLTLTDPTWGARSLHLQNGCPIHRVRAHSLTRAQNTSGANSLFHVLWQFRVALEDLCAKYSTTRPYHPG
jgi:hypothetical protein